MIYGTVFSNTPLNAQIMDQLVHVACEMTIQEKTRSKIVHDDVSGTIKTAFELIQYGEIFGFGFEADIVTEKGIGNVKFVLQLPTEDPNDILIKWHKQAADLGKRRIDPSLN